MQSLQPLKQDPTSYSKGYTPPPVPHPVWRTRSASTCTELAKDNPLAAPCHIISLAWTVHNIFHISHQWDPFPLVSPSPKQPQVALGALLPHTCFTHWDTSHPPCTLQIWSLKDSVLFSNYKPGYGGGNTWFSWLASSKTSLWDVFVYESPLQYEVPAKSQLNQFLCLLSKSCLPHLHSSPCLRAKSHTCFSVCPQPTDTTSLLI